MCYYCIQCSYLGCCFWLLFSLHNVSHKMCTMFCCAMLSRFVVIIWVSNGSMCSVYPYPSGTLHRHWFHHYLTYIICRLLHGPDCFTVSTLCTYTDLGNRGYLGIYCHSSFSFEVTWVPNGSMWSVFPYLSGLLHWHWGNHKRLGEIDQYYTTAKHISMWTDCVHNSWDVLELHTYEKNLWNSICISVVVIMIHAWLSL